MDELRKAAGTAVDVWDDTGTRHEDVVNAMNDLRKVLAKNANAAPDSSLAPQIESLIAEYWDIAYEEGKTGISQGDLANQVLGRIRNALIAWAQRAAPQDQDAKDAARYRWLRDHASNDWLDSGITDDAVDEAINDKSQWRKKP